jgi:hypothetical protein
MVLKKGLKNDLNPPFLYRLGGLKNSTTIKQEPFKKAKAKLFFFPAFFCIRYWTAQGKSMGLM